MIDSRTTTARTLAFGALVCLMGTLTVSTPRAAHAQFGGLIKKAKDKVAGNPSSSNGSAPQFNETTIELGSDKLAQVIKGLQAEHDELAGTGGRQSVNALAQQQKSATELRSSLLDKHNNEIQVYNSEVSRIEQCRDNVFNQREKQNSAQMQAIAMSPEFQAKAMKTTQEMAAAQARGDTATVRKLREELMAPVMAKTRADSLAADQRCSKVPAKPSYVVQIDSLSALEDKLNDEIRQRQQQAATAAVRTSGLTDLQFATARERIVGYLSSTNGHGSPRGFSQTELDALNARASELRRLVPLGSSS